MRNGISRFLLGWGLVLLAGPLTASGLTQTDAQVESSMLLTGSIHIAADGTVQKAEINKAQKLTPALAEFIEQTALTWRFEPVMQQGTAVAVESPMSIRLVAQESAAGDYRAMIGGVGFDVYDPDDPTQVRWKSTRPPEYPNIVARAGVAADVYLALKIGRNGKVEDSMVRQINVHALESERTMERWRTALASASLRAARDWTFTPPSRGEAVNAPFWVVTVPVAFRLDPEPTKASEREATWVAYVPGPLQPLPWLAPTAYTTLPDVLPDGGVYLEGVAHGPKLLTPLDPG